MAADGAADAADVAADAGADVGARVRVHVEITDVNVETGAIPGLEGALALARPALRGCVEIWSRGDEGVAGSATLDVRLDRKSKATKAKVVSQERLGADVRACFERVIRRTDFGDTGEKARYRATVRWVGGGG